MKYLKYIRVAISLYFFSVLFLSFLGIGSVISMMVLRESSTFIQFIPSLLRSFVMPVTAIGFVIVIILTLLYGRIYCSFICPLGTFQDATIRVSGLINKKKRFKFSKPHNLLRYIILAMVVVSLLTGSVLLLNLLDPYSNFGKIVSGIIRPVAILVNDGLASIFNKMGSYALNPVGIKNIHWIALIFPSLFLTTLLLMTFRRGRLFCNTVCPVGSFLSIFARFSVFKIKINDSLCTSCGKCSLACKAECINVKEKQVDFSRCISCLNCIQACTEKGVNYKVTLLNKEINNQAIKQEQAVALKVSNNRRDFFNKSLVLLGAGAVLTRAKTAALPQKEVVIIKKEHAVTPPGSYSFENFSSHCTACHLCLSACPSQVIKPSLFQYGISGMMQPYLDFNDSFCNYECVVCSEVCPTGALLPINNETKKNIQIGKVIFIKKNCIVYTDEKSCGACAEHCPTKAVRMVPYLGAITIPQTDVSICVGCGACEYACPADPEKAIYVEGNLVHQTAFKFKDEKPTETAPEEFPF